MTNADLPARAEEAGLNALPAPRQILLGPWLLRFADGFTRRANAATPLADAPPPRDVDRRVRQCAALYSAQGLPCLFRLPSFLPHGLDAVLDSHGFAPAEGETRILFRPAAATDGAAPPDVTLTEGAPVREWLDAQARIAGNDARTARARGDLLAALAIPAAFAAVRAEGPRTPMVSLACVAVHDGLACINMVATDPAARRRGHARHIMLALLAWARAAGADAACLQVAADNSAAITLYEGLGFTTELYRYHYRRLPLARA